MLSEKIESARVMAIGAVCDSGVQYNSSEASLDELASLVKTAGGEVFCTVLQNRKSPDPATFIGEGKVKEAKDIAAANEIDLAVFDGELSPSQLKNLENELELRIIDRSMLILDIFALHAVTREGKLQVELAQLKYTMPRLTGKGIELSRLGGGIGTRGPGETKLETDRRHIRTRIAALKEELAVLEKNRGEQRKSRDNSGIARVGIIGYTNAGKSTLLNLLTGADLLAEDKLFATLDPTTRKFKFKSGLEMLLTDTVGFIRNLPHHLIEAFASTLDEVKYSDLLLHVVDISSPEYAAQTEVVDNLVSELGGGEIPRIMIYNKSDLADKDRLPYTRDGVIISAKNSENIEALIIKIENTLNDNKIRMKLLIPYDKASALEIIHKNTSIEKEEFRDSGIYFEIIADKKEAGRLKDYEQL